MSTDFEDLVARYPEPIRELTVKLDAFLVGNFPELRAVTRFGWGTINYTHPRAGFLCAIYPRADHVSLILQQGRLLSSPLLKGEGENLKQVRYIPLTPGGMFPEDDMAILLVEAIALRA